jgi:hypothetical protein
MKRILGVKKRKQSAKDSFVPLAHAAKEADPDIVDVLLADSFSSPTTGTYNMSEYSLTEDELRDVENAKKRSIRSMVTVMAGKAKRSNKDDSMETTETLSSTESLSEDDEQIRPVHITVKPREKTSASNAVKAKRTKVAYSPDILNEGGSTHAASPAISKMTNRKYTFSPNIFRGDGTKSVVPPAFLRNLWDDSTSVATQSAAQSEAAESAFTELTPIGDITSALGTTSAHRISRVADDPLWEDSVIVDHSTVASRDFTRDSSDESSTVASSTIGRRRKRSNHNNDIPRMLADMATVLGEMVHDMTTCGTFVVQTAEEGFCGTPQEQKKREDAWKALSAKGKRRLKSRRR